MFFKKLLILFTFISLNVIAEERNRENDLITDIYYNVSDYINKKNENRRFKKALEGFYINFNYSRSYYGENSDNRFADNTGIDGVSNNLTISNRNGPVFDNFYYSIMYAININNYIIAPEIGKYVSYGSKKELGYYTNYKINFGVDVSDNSSVLLGVGLNRSKTQAIEGMFLFDYGWHFLIEPSYIYRFNEKYSFRASVRFDTSYEKTFEYKSSFTGQMDRSSVKYNITTFSIGFMYKF